ncbi:MAG: FAD-dependent oxidoreductase [Sphingobacteriaceae bacterium]
MKKIILLVLALSTQIALGETIKTDVLVVGGGAGGTAAGIQSARSNLKTIIIEQGPWLGGSMTAAGMCILEANKELAAGIWGEFRNGVNHFYSNTPGVDTAQNATLRFEPHVGAIILKKMTDTVKNLTVRLNTPWTAIKKDGTGWEITIINNGKTDIIKARVVIDGTETADVAAQAGASFTSGFDSEKQTNESLALETASPLIQNISWIAILKDYGKAADRTIPKPEGYNAALYDCLLAGTDIKKLLEKSRLPNNKYVLNWAPCGNDYPATVEELTTEKKVGVYAKAKLRTLGLIYYLQTQLGMKNLSLDFQEFNTPDQLPYAPYIREARRANGQVRFVQNDIYQPYDRSSKLYRTSLGVGDALPEQIYSHDMQVPRIDYPPFPGYSVPMGAIILKDLENLLVIEKGFSTTHLVNGSTLSPAVQMSIGQGAGAVAAFCAFFKVTTKTVDIRIIQAEILTYKGIIMPFSDIKFSDPNFKSIQRIGVTGILKGVQRADGAAAPVFFQPDSVVKTLEIKAVMNELFSRSFLWFNREKPKEDFTLENLLSYISEINLNDPKSLRNITQSRWQTQYKFQSEFNLKKGLTRREFAVLTDIYLKPFDKKIDISGKILN